MFDNTKVTLDLKDFDYLRQCEEELKTLKRNISRAVTSEQTYDETDVKAVKLKIDTDKINDIIYEYHAWSKDEDEWINECVSKEQINFEYV